jgi:DcmR-like sensory protein/histidine kinase-like protein
MPRARAALEPHDHAVTFYEADSDVVAEVARFVAAGLALGDPVIVVATQAHHAAIDDALARLGTDADWARATGCYLTADAADTLAAFLVDGAPDAAKFQVTVGSLIDQASPNGRPVRVFGEMVALLWQEGNVAGAVELEALWNDLARKRRFSLLCGYAMSDVVEQPDLSWLRQVCRLHSAMVQPRSYEEELAVSRQLSGDPSVRVDERSDVFLPLPVAVRAVRRFVSRSVASWGEEQLEDDALLVATELATNALRHAESPFRLLLSRSDTVVRIAIEDVGPARPHLVPPADPHRLDGRGVSLVALLSRRWGCDIVPGGKVVWAELSRTD